MKQERLYESPTLMIHEISVRTSILTVSGSNITDYVIDDSHTFEEE